MPFYRLTLEEVESLPFPFLTSEETLSSRADPDRSEGRRGTSNPHGQGLTTIIDEALSSRADRARRIRAACSCSTREARDLKSSWAGAHHNRRGEGPQIFMCQGLARNH